MDCRGRKREDAAEQLPADKRACSSSGLRAGPSSSHSPTVHPIASSSTTTTNAVTGGDVESSSGRSERDSVSVDGSCDSDDGGVDDDDEDDEPGEGFRGDHVEFSKGKIKKILSGLEDEADPGAQLSALTELNETLSLCMEDSLMCLSMETLVPLLVKLAGQEDKPDIMLMAIRSLTYLCDLMPRLSGVLVRHGALPVLCARLMAIQYLDVAEQCLQALEKISRNQPAPCLQAGTIVAALTYIDFFTTSVQRVALSTVANVCKKLPSDCSSLVKESIPTLCNLLQYEDRKLVETAAICLIRITEGFSGSSEMLDELCKHGVVHKSASLIASDGRMTLSQTTYIGLIGLLTRLASGSVIAVRTLFELNISSILRDILITCGISNSTTFSLVSHEQSNQVHEVLKLLNQLIPPVAKENKDIKLTMDKEKILVDEPKLLHQFASDILPISIQVVNSGANLTVCYGCVSIITNIVYFSTPDMLLDLLKDTNISSFLSGILTRKDHHVLFSALKTAEILLQRHRDVFLSSFIKEGVVCAIGALLVPENSVVRNSCQPVHLQPSTDSHSQMSMKDVKRCLCYAFDACPSSSSSEAEDCRLGNEAVLNLATSLYTIYLTSASTDFEMGLTEALQKLKSLSALLIDNVDKLSKNDYSAENEECLSQILEEIVMELICGEPLSTFEFIESGIVRSLAFYLSNGVHLQGNVDNQSIIDHFHVVMKRFEKFASISLSKSAHHWESMPLTLLIRKLQSALSSFDPFPVILSGTSKPRNVYANIPVGRSTTVPCLKVCFMVAEGETILSDYSANAVTVEPSSSLDAIEGFLWPKVSTNRTEQHSESAGKCLNETGEDINVSHIKGNKEPQDNCTKITGKLQNLSSSLLEGITKQEIRHLPEAGGTMRAGVPVTENPSSPASTDKGHNVGRQCSASHHNGNAPPKLTFYFEGKQLDRSLTLYQQILQQQVNAQPDMIVGPKFWNEVYKVTYKRAEQKARDLEVSSSGSLSLNAWGKAGISWPKPSFFSSELVAELPCKLEKSNPSYDILFMLKILEGLNRFSFHLMSYEKSKAFGERRIVDFDDLMVISPLIPQTEFQSSKLTEKLEQQMRDPLALSTGSMPSWCCQLMAACPFLFSFEARWKYLRMTAFNSSQVQQSSMPQLNSNIDHSSSGQRSHTQTYSRKRFRVDRSHVLESAAKMMALHARNNAALEVEYFEEIGTGVGPTMEFYTLASREFQKVGLGMWRGDDRSSISPLREGTSTSVDDSKYVVAPLGLFPRPWSAATSSSNEIQFSKVTEKFVLLGQVVAKALQDGRILDLPFSGAFYKLILGQELDIYDIHSFDPELGKTLLEFQALVDRKRFLESTMVDITQANSVLHFRGTDVEDLCLDFTLPGYSDYLLASGSSSKMVNIDNLEEYVSLTVDATVRSGISRQLDAFKSGFNQVFPLKALHIFTVGELERLLCGEQDTLSFDDLLDHIKFDHGYTSSSPPVTSLLETIQELECNQQRAFLQFVTGAPRLPPGGLAALSPKLTIVRKHCSDCVDMALPSVMTCANYLKLPPYSSKERTKERLLYAITEGQGSFHLS